ncbi:MAG: ATP-binding protein [Phycisphaerales bacterium]
MSERGAEVEGTPDQAVAFLAGGGEMAKTIQAMDWSQTPLGPIESWPQSLRTTVSLALASNFPISIAWGASRTQIYNDGYWPICGAKHPESMGQDFKECWFSAWPAIGDAFESASNGKTAFLVNQRMFLDRYGYLEETFFTFSFSPIRDETGRVVGLFHPVTELTQQSLAERRLQVLRDLADRAVDAKSVQDAFKLIGDTLASHNLDVPFALFYQLDKKSARAQLAACTGIERGSVAAPASIDCHDESSSIWPVGEAARKRQPIQVDDLIERTGGLECDPYPESPHTAFVLPVLISGLEYPFGVLIAGASSRRSVDEHYRTFYYLLREAVTNVITNARAYEEERRRAEALAELDRAKTQFFSNVSHEFRTPLTLMLGPVEDMLRLDDEALGDGNRAQLEIVHRNSLRLLKLVNTMLDFSRIEAGRIRANYEPTDLAAATAELASNFRAAIERADMRLLVNCQPLDQPVYVDRDMWEKIVLNLMSNAFKYTIEGEIEVSLEARDGHASLAVRDTGVGIPAEEMSRVFERFHRVQHTRGRTHEGTGIGLALVQELVKLHGGRVMVESVEHEGSVFRVDIPFGVDHLDPERIGRPPELAPTRTGPQAFVEEAMRWLPSESKSTDDGANADKTTATELTSAAPGLGGPLRDRSAASGRQERGPQPRIVWADDNADMREYVARVLGGRCEVDAFPDGEAALEAIRRRPPDLVLSDIMMPRLDGMGLLREVRDDPMLRHIPVVLLSARAGEEARIEGLDAGADEYLVKPFSARELLACVDSQVRLSRLRREAEQAARESEERFRMMADTAPAMLWISESDGACSFFSRGWYDYTGRDDDECMGDGWLDAVHPDDRELARRIFDDAHDSRSNFSIDFRLRRADGEYRWAINAARPRFSDEDEFVGFIGSVIDVHERKVHEDRMRTVMAELNHRVKNNLAVVNSIAQQTIKRSPDLESFRHSFEQRLQSIAKAHALLTKAEWEGASLDEIVRSELDARVASSDQVAVDGPLITMGPKATLGLHMVVHELATNAAKYGALRSPEGRIRVEWRVEDSHDHGKRLELTWSETTPRPIAKHEERGYGTRLIERIVEFELHGEVERSLEPRGLECRFRFPLEGSSVVIGSLPSRVRSGEGS